MQAVTIGIDLAKHVFQAHGVSAGDKVVFSKPLRRAQMLPFFAKLTPCLIGMEACASAHYWARELKKLGHEVRLMPAKDVKAYVKRNKNDAIDAAACCEAVRRPVVRTVPVKTPEQQAQLMQHRVRDLLIRQRTQAINALRAHLAELGIVAAQGYDGALRPCRRSPWPPWRGRRRDVHHVFMSFLTALGSLGAFTLDFQTAVHSLTRLFECRARPAPS